MNDLRDTLFGDRPINQWIGNGVEFYPWSAFDEARGRLEVNDTEGAVKIWKEIVERPDLESRHYLQAWYYLREKGVNPPPEIAKQVLGVVVEVCMPEGLDLLAAYADHSARYYNYSGAAVIWDHPDTSLDGLIDELLEESNNLIEMLGVSPIERPPAPPLDHARISFLTPGGLGYGEGPIEVLMNDPTGGVVMGLATELLVALIDLSDKPLS